MREKNGKLVLTFVSEDEEGGDFDDDNLEPPIPAGLAQLSASLEVSSSS